MSEKIYQIESEKIGVINFLKPWILIHIKNNEHKVQFFNSSTKKSIISFEKYFSSKFLKDFSIERKIDFFEYIINKYDLKQINLIIDKIKEQKLEFSSKKIEELKINNIFLALLVINICFYYNQLQFKYEEIDIIIKVVDKFLAVDFWTKK